MTDLILTGTLSHPAGYQTNVHAHPFGQLTHIRQGVLHVVTETTGTGMPSTSLVPQRSLIPQSCFIWIPPDWPHHAFSHTEIMADVVQVPASPATTLPHQPAIFAITPFILALIQRLTHDNKTQTIKQHLLAVLVDEILQQAPLSFSLPMPQSAGLQDMARQILQMPDDKIPLAERARQTGMSERTFSRKFSKETGMTWAHWRQVVRLFHAIEWLQQGKPVSWVALTCGYSHPSALVAVFRQHFGCSPNAWKQKETQKSSSTSGA
ncbi:AraC family transcriptional regulator [Vibrio quintilis]|uniref:HTH-type transcriptional repressor of iron proteins A n=1 Tax=Vibrio quintilis TaxID=1117707 RepID=A0A1M7YV42_9VIBR|nr:AraC family transcriptional regulator [Vibrio quintilis]SHO56547.1 HTH-type transcriptional repressor of iron proteins A [Vibrio quintilis]